MMYQRIIRWCFRFFQARLKVDTVSRHKTLTTPSELGEALDELRDYNELETSVVVHNIGQSNQYMCLVYVGRDYNGGDR